MTVLGDADAFIGGRQLLQDSSKYTKVKSTTLEKEYVVLDENLFNVSSGPKLIQLASGPQELSKECLVTLLRWSLSALVGCRCPAGLRRCCGYCTPTLALTWI